MGSFFKTIKEHLRINILYIKSIDLLNDIHYHLINSLSEGVYYENKALYTINHTKSSQQKVYRLLGHVIYWFFVPVSR